jgi:hypothetical protein
VDVDAQEFLHTFEDEGSEAGKLVDRLIDQDDPTITKFLRSVASKDREAMQSTAKILLSKS